MKKIVVMICVSVFCNSQIVNAIKWQTMTQDQKRMYLIGIYDGENYAASEMLKMLIDDLKKENNDRLMSFLKIMYEKHSENDNLLKGFDINKCVELLNDYYSDPKNATISPSDAVKICLLKYKSRKK